MDLPLNRTADLQMTLTAGRPTAAHGRRIGPLGAVVPDRGRGAGVENV